MLNHDSHLARPAHSAGRPLLAALACGAALLGLPRLTLAQPDTGATPERWLVSTTADLPGSVGLLDGDDACLVQVQPGVGPHLNLSTGSWFALAGFQPGDIDAVGLRPAGLASSGGAHRNALCFSLLSNEAGFLDGDVLGLGPDGTLEVLVPEAVLLERLGLVGTNIDVDALDHDDEGRLLFSVQSFLSGSVLGDIQNGDVLRIEHDDSLTRVATEDEVQAALLGATGLTDPVGDVHGLTWFEGRLWVTVQGPGTIDGSALGLGSQPQLAFVEDGIGLAGAELDALVALDPSWQVGSIVIDKPVSFPGEQLHGEGHGFTPFAPLWVLTAGSQASASDYGLFGFGDVLLDPLDPWLAQATGAGLYNVVLADALGSFAIDFALPPDSWGGVWSGGSGWSFQVIDLADLAITAPYRVQL